MTNVWPIRVVILLAVIASFGRLGLHEFTGWDDPGTIHQNPSFNPPTLPKIAWYWTAWGERAPMGLYVPLTYTVWGALAKIAYLQTPDPTGIRLNPYVYHSANVLLHALGAVATFELLRLLVRRDWAACAGALLWALHPVQVEPVGWASGTKDVLCGLLAIVALWQYVLFTRSDPIVQRRSAWHYALATLAFAGAMLAKPTGIVTPLMALVIDIWILLRPWPRATRALVPWVLLTIPIIIVTKLSQITLGVPTAALWLRPLVALDALAFYLCKLVLPIHLAVDYGRRPARVLEEGWIWFTWVVPVALAVVLFVWRKRAPHLIAAATLFVIGVLPVLGFLPFQFQYYSTVADHYLYLSMLGPALALAWALERWPTRPVAIVAGAALVLLGILSFNQAKYWRDDIVLFEHNIDVNPRSFVAHNNLAAALFQKGRIENDRRMIELAERHFRRAIEIFPDYPSGHDNLANLLVRTGRLEAAIVHIKEVLRVSRDLPPALRPNLDRAHNDLGVYLMSRGQLDEAISHFRAALEFNPANPQAQQNLQDALRRQGEASTRPAP